MRSHRIPDPTAIPWAGSWRVTTAVRVFTLALAFGQMLGAPNLEAVTVTFLAMVLLAAVSCAVELEALGRGTPWVPVFEGILATALIATGVAQVVPLMIYLAVPPVVAGIRHGWVTTLNTSLVSGIVMLGAWVAAETLGRDATQFTAALPWLAIGLGAGLLASWQTRSLRMLEASQAPYAAAHRLVSQLHTISHQLPMGLDSTTMAERLLAEIRGIAATEQASVLVVRGAALVPLAARPQGKPSGNAAAQTCIEHGRVVQTTEVTALPLRVGSRHFGVVLLHDSRQPSKPEVTELQHLLDDRALRLDTALLFDEVRSLATTEERNRLARDIHDGVAQEIVSLGYLADEIAAVSRDPAARQAADDLRAEITRIISELRFSIFDLRRDVDMAGSFSGALAEYVREVGARSDLRVHLLFDERGARVPQHTEEELLRIAQEAIGNVQRHSGAINLWVTLTTDGQVVRLVVEDDGVGRALPRAGHYGLHTMRERAERINADLTVDARPDGGTIVTLQSRSRPATGTEQEHPYDDQRPARR